MALPLLLAGPILRRVDPNLVSVWLALSEPAKVSLVVYEGIATAANANPVRSPARPRTRGGSATSCTSPSSRARIPETDARSLQPDILYSYDLSINAGGTAHDLASLNMLRDATPEDSPDGRAHLALGYQPDLLPSFAPCPSKLTDVRILYGSCRLPSCRDPDALAYVDDYIHDHVQDPRSRPHQLILGGDQVYADDVDTLMMIGLIGLAGELIGLVNPDDPATADARRAPPRRQGPEAHGRRRRHRLDRPGQGVRGVRRGRQHRPGRPPPAGRRRHLPARTPPRAHQARRRSSPARTAPTTCSPSASSPRSTCSCGATPAGPTRSPARRSCPTPRPTPPASTRQPLKWTSKPTPKSRIDLPPLVFPELRLRAPLPAARPAGQARQADARPEGEGRATSRSTSASRACARSHRIHAEFLVGLPKVQRALANVPTYMMLDDHEITDDLFLSPTWRDRVLSTRRSACRSSTTACSPTPCSRTGATTRCATTAGCRPSCAPGPPSCSRPGRPPARRRRRSSGCRVLFGHDLRNEADGVGGFRGANPPIHWHFTVDAPKHRLIALDNRTRRSYAGRARSARQRVGRRAWSTRCPAPPLPAGQQLLVVIAPLQVIGPPVIDDLVAPASFRAFDLGIAASSKYDTSDLSPRSPTGLRQMFGTNPDAIETWAIDAPVFEQLLERLEPYERVVLLSGDVHNSSATAMSYWRGNGDAAGALRAVHVERVQERDAGDDHRRRPGCGVRPADGPRQPRHRAPRLGAPAGRHGAAADRSQRRRPRAAHALAPAGDAGAAADLGLARRQRRCRPTTPPTT